MGCLRSLTIVGTISCNFLALGWMVLVLLMGKTLGNAAIIGKDDALFGLVLLVIAFFGNALLALLLLVGRRSRRKASPAGIELMGEVQSSSVTPSA